MSWLQVGTGFGLGVIATIGYGFYIKYQENKEIDEELEQEEQFIINVIESILFLGVEYDDVTTIVAPTETMGVVAIKIVFHQENEDVIKYAVVKGKEVFLVNASQWAYILGEEGVRAIPCMEDLDGLDDGYYEIDDDSED
jgi:hypothetical protein